MWKRAIFLGAATAMLVSCTYYGIHLLVLSNRLRVLAPRIAKSMEQVADGLAGKDLICADDGAHGAEKMSFAQLQDLVEDYGRYGFLARTYELESPARILVEDEMGLTDAVRRLRDGLDAFSDSLKSWLHACDGAGVTPAVQKQLADDGSEMKRLAGSYREAMLYNERRVRLILGEMCVVLGLDVVLVVVLVGLLRKMLNAPVRAGPLD